MYSVGVQSRVSPIPSSPSVWCTRSNARGIFSSTIQWHAQLVNQTLDRSGLSCQWSALNTQSGKSLSEVLCGQLVALQTKLLPYFSSEVFDPEKTLEQLQTLLNSAELSEHFESIKNPAFQSTIYAFIRGFQQDHLGRDLVIPIHPSSDGCFESWHEQSVAGVADLLQFLEAKNRSLVALLLGLGCTRYLAAPSKISVGLGGSQEVGVGAFRTDNLYTRLLGNYHYHHYSFGGNCNRLLFYVNCGSEFAVKEMIRPVSWAQSFEMTMTEIFYRASRPDHVRHTSPSAIFPILLHIEGLLEVFLCNLEGSNAEKIAQIAEIHWFFAHATVFQRGSASIAEVFSRALFKIAKISPPQMSGVHKNFTPQEREQLQKIAPPNLTRDGILYKRGVGPFVFMELEAMMMPLKVYQENYVTLLKTIASNAKWQLPS